MCLKNETLFQDIRNRVSFFDDKHAKKERKSQDIRNEHREK